MTAWAALGRKGTLTVLRGAVLADGEGGLDPQCPPCPPRSTVKWWLVLHFRASKTCPEEVPATASAGQPGVLLWADALVTSV